MKIDSIQNGVVIDHISSTVRSSTSIRLLIIFAFQN